MKRAVLPLLLLVAAGRAGAADEALLRRAVKAGPNEPECWSALADCLTYRGYLALLGEGTAPNIGARLAERLAEKKITAEGARLAVAALDEALVCCDRAVQAAPG